jgi:serine/threonine-protein kinase RsbW
MHLKDSIPADAQAISQALDTARRFADHVALPPIARMRLLLTVEELLANIVTHGQPSPDSGIDIQFEIREDRIELRTQDAGSPFDPRLDIPSVSRDQAVEAGMEGGVGWPMILEWCAIEDYQREGGANRLLLSLPTRDVPSNR